MKKDDRYDDYLSNLLNGDRRGCSGVVDELVDTETLADIYEQYFKKSMYEVGDLWADNKISVAKEHMATAITEEQVGKTYPLVFSEKRNGKKAIVACVADEYHQLGGKLVANLLEHLGWDTLFLGANTPTHDLLDMIEQEKPDLIGLSISIYFNMKNLLTAIDAIREKVNTPILVGGQAFQHGGKEAVESRENVILADPNQPFSQLLDRLQSI